MAQTIFINFCGFIVGLHSNPKNMALSAFSGKIFLTGKIFFNFLSAPNVATKPTDQSCSDPIFRVLSQLSPDWPIHCLPCLNIKGVHIRNKKRTDWHTWNFTNMMNCFCRYVIKSTGEIAKKVLLSIFWNLLFIDKISLKLGYRTVNARKYVRCARIFYLFCWLHIYLDVQWDQTSQKCFKCCL